MEIDNTFEVPLPPGQAWKVLMDIERIAPCLPGAELTEVIDPETFKGKVSVRLGPVALTFQGQVKFEDLDHDKFAARVKAQGTDAKGRGGANADVTFNVESTDGGSRVLIHTDMQLSGSVAQYGRGVGMIQDLSSHLIGQFADNLRKQIEEGGADTAAEGAEGGAGAQPAPSAKPISGLSLGLRVLWNAILRLFGAGAKQG